MISQGSIPQLSKPGPATKMGPTRQFLHFSAQKVFDIGEKWYDNRMRIIIPHLGRIFVPKIYVEWGEEKFPLPSPGAPFCFAYNLSFQPNFLNFILPLFCSFKILLQNFVSYQLHLHIWSYVLYGRLGLLPFLIQQERITVFQILHIHHWVNMHL